MSKRAKIRELFVNALSATGQDTVTIDEIKDVCVKLDISYPYWFTNDTNNRMVIRLSLSLSLSL